MPTAEVAAEVLDALKVKRLHIVTHQARTQAAGDTVA
jgi:hypothetical protein